MNSRLDLELIMEDHELKVIDPFDYSEWAEDNEHNCKHLIIRCLIKNSTIYDNKMISLNCTEINPDDFNRGDADYKYTVEEDGLYSYREILIPEEHHGGNEDIWYINRGTEKSPDWKICYKESEHDINLITFDETYDLIVKGDNVQNCFWYDGYTFTLSDLITCYVKLEQKVLEEYTCKCKEPCNIDNETNAKLTILSAAIHTIDYLLQSDTTVDDAQEILDRLSGCSGLCDNNTKKCNCGRIV